MTAEEALLMAVARGGLSFTEPSPGVHCVTADGEDLFSVHVYNLVYSVDPVHVEVYSRARDGALVQSRFAVLPGTSPADAAMCAIVTGMVQSETGWPLPIEEARRLSSTHAATDAVMVAPRLGVLWLSLEDRLKWALGFHVREAVERVRRELAVLAGRLSEGEWLELHRQAVVEQVHAA